MRKIKATISKLQRLLAANGEFSKELNELYVLTGGRGLQWRSMVYIVKLHRALERPAGARRAALAQRLAVSLQLAVKVDGLPENPA